MYVKTIFLKAANEQLISGAERAAQKWVGLKLGQIYFVRDLPKEIFRQPEGISFDPIGNMIIVSEGAGAKSMLFEFRYQPNPPAPAETESGESLSVFPHL